MPSSAVLLADSVANSLAIAPSTWRSSSPESSLIAISSEYAKAASRFTTFGTISLWVYPCFSEREEPN